jgi:hypothetical protein
MGSAVTPSVARAIRPGYRAPAVGAPLRVLTPQQNELVATVTELIIPATDTPGARGARVDAFIDGMMADVFTQAERDRFTAGLADLDARAQKANGVAFLKATPEQQIAILNAMQAEKREPDSKTRPFFSWLKELTLFGYYTSEIGASQELHYVHVAGRYDGDIPYVRGRDRAYS